MSFKHVIDYGQYDKPWIGGNDTTVTTTTQPWDGRHFIHIDDAYPAPPPPTVTFTGATADEVAGLRKRVADLEHCVYALTLGLLVVGLLAAL